MFAEKVCKGPVMPSSREFARRVIAAFADAGLSTDALIGAAGGPSTTTMTKLRKVAEGEDTMPEPREPTWSKIDNAAKWLPGSARRVWRGGDPTPRAEEHDDALDDIVWLTPVFDALPSGTRGTLLDIAEALAHRSPARPDYVVRDAKGEELGVEVTTEWSGLSHASAQLVQDAATEVLWDHPNVTSVVVQVASADGSLDGFTMFRRSEPPEVRVRERPTGQDPDEPDEADIAREQAIDAWRDRDEADPYDESLPSAARDIGKPSRGQRDRDAADQAGEPPVDNPDDMEPR